MGRIVKPRKRFFTAGRASRRYLAWWIQNRKRERYGVTPFLTAEVWDNTKLWIN